MIKVVIAIVAVFFIPISHAEIKRSSHAVSQFKKSHKCPATGRIEKRCAGFIIDHRIPLVCGGKDDQSNMQWQSVEEAKAKDKWERKNCAVWF